MDLLEKVKHFIEEESYNALEAIYNAELVKFGKCAVISKKILSTEDSSACSDISKNETCQRLQGAFQHIIFNSTLCSFAP